MFKLESEVIKAAKSVATKMWEVMKNWPMSNIYDMKQYKKKFTQDKYEPPLVSFLEVLDF